MLKNKEKSDNYVEKVVEIPFTRLYTAFTLAKEKYTPLTGSISRGININPSN